MKKYFILAAAAIAMASCSNDEGANVAANDGTIRLTTDVSKAGTRTIDQTIQATQIVNGGKVAVEFTTGSNATITDAVYWKSSTTANATYTADGNGNLSGASVKWPMLDGSGTVSVEAWYPFTTKPDLDSDKFKVEKDQSTEANYAASDYLHGAPSSSFAKAAIANPIKIIFQHMLTKINVNVTMADGSSVLGAKVVFGPNTMKLDGTIGTNNAVKNDGTTTGAITMATLDAAGTASCIIIPQTLNNGEDLITVTLGTETYKYTLPVGKTYDASKAYTYNVSLADGETIILSEQITDWTYESAESVIAKQ